MRGYSLRVLMTAERFSELPCWVVIGAMVEGGWVAVGLVQRLGWCFP